MNNTDELSITLTVNGEQKVLTVGRSETLLSALRRASYLSVKHGCGTGDCGACTVLLDGQPVYSCMTPAVQVEGREVVTLEALTYPPLRGEEKGLPPEAGGTLHPIQRAFIETGAIQCGYCTPAQILVAKALLDRNPDPTEEEIREALQRYGVRLLGMELTNAPDVLVEWEMLAREGMRDVKVSLLGIPDRFIPHGPPRSLRSSIGLDAAGIRRKVLELMGVSELRPRSARPKM